MEAIGVGVTGDQISANNEVLTCAAPQDFPAWVVYPSVALLLLLPSAAPFLQWMLDGLMNSLPASVPGSAGDWAAWVGAIGTVGAIFGSVAITRWQMNRTERRRLQAHVLGLRAIFKHSYFPLAEIGAALENWRSYQNPKQIDVQVLQEVIDAFHRFPLHEIRDPDLISEALSLQVRLRRLKDVGDAIFSAQAINVEPAAMKRGARETIAGLELFLCDCDRFLAEVGRGLIT